MQKFHLDLFERLQPYDHVIWDWNGTIVNDFEQAVLSVNELLSEHQLPLQTVENYKKAFRFPIRDLYTELGFDLTKLCFNQLCDRYAEVFNKNRAYKARLHDGIKDFLEDLSLHKTQSILTAAVQWHIDDITKHYDVYHLFDYIYGIDNLHATGKVHRGHELMQASKTPPEKTILIGDTDHDAEVAAALGIEVLLIADGFQDYERLSRIRPETIPTRYI